MGLNFFTGLDFLADGGADFEHAISLTGKNSIIKAKFIKLII